MASTFGPSPFPAGWVWANLVLMLLLAFTNVCSGQDSTVILPVLSGVQAVQGSLAGGTFLTVWGTGFHAGGMEGVTNVFIGNSLCPSIPYYSDDTKIVCLTPPSSIEG